MESLKELAPLALQVIRNNLDQDNYKVAMWLIEEIVGKPKQKTELTGAEGKPLQVYTISAMLSDDIVRQRIGELVDAMAIRSLPSADATT